MRIGKQSADFVKEYFSSSAITVLPYVEKLPDNWVAVSDKSLLIIFPEDKDFTKKMENFTAKGWHPLPLLATTNKKVKVAFEVTAKNCLLMSNHVSNMFSLRVSPEATIVIQNHLQEFTDVKTGADINYKIDIAFVLGLKEGEGWDSVEDRLKDLLDYFLTRWKGLHG